MEGDVQMSVWIAWLIAIVCAAAFATLWFWEVRRIMRNRMSTLDSAATQLAACRKRAAQTPDDPGAAAVLQQSERIYYQAVELYRKTLKKPWIWPPAVLMGFRSISPEGAKCSKPMEGGCA